ncbi:MAG: superoxide dismutase family protein [Saprospiraceae bacterium]|nr:superoxide dismutase family protein [Saprospiraceae bacterium]
MLNTRSLIPFILILLVLSACKKEAKSTETTEQEEGVTLITAQASIDSKSGSTLTGDALFTQVDDQVTLKLTIENASPGIHAAHIHQNGDCSSEDGKSAGGHWNPTEHDHGKWGEGQFHKGDIGNIKVGEDGKGSIELTTDLWAIGGDDAAKNVLGKSIIVHAKADDFATQPTGNAGGREGCGVIVK